MDNSIPIVSNYYPIDLCYEIYNRVRTLDLEWGSRSMFWQGWN